MRKNSKEGKAEADVNPPNAQVASKSPTRERKSRSREPKPSGSKVHLPLAGSHQPLAYEHSGTEGHRSRSDEMIRHKGQGSAEECTLEHRINSRSKSLCILVH